jgi:putative flippase GtrA
METAKAERKAKLALKYAAFAAIATAVNIGIQRIFLAVYHGRYALWAAMACGTGAGLLLKYVLDKRYIFRFIVHNRYEDVYKFVLYALMGAVTTGIFWGTEYLFDVLLSFPVAKYLGAFTGLCLGYTAKYFLDKRFVFGTGGEARGQETRRGA